MDEPLSNLDAKLRVQTRTQIASLQRRLGVTTVYVTHDQIEAMTMGDRVAVLKDGILQQVDTPRDLYDRPNNVFVAGFIGSPAMNLVSVPVTEGGVQFGSHRRPASTATLLGQGRQPGHRRRPPRGRRRSPTNEDGLAVDRRRRRGARRRRLRLRHPASDHVKLEGGDDGLAKPSSRASTAARCPTRGRRSTSTPTPTTCTCSTPRAAPASAEPTPLLHATPRTSPSAGVRGITAGMPSRPRSPS